MSPAAPRPASRQPRRAVAAHGAHPRPPLPPGPYAVIGLARSGTAAALALAQRGERVFGLDAAAPAALAQLSGAGVRVQGGEQAQDLPHEVRAVIKSPGVPDDAAPVVEARRRGLVLLGELELGWRLLDNQFIAVTGTNGKTTTCELIGHIHRVAGLPVVVAGNVGTALSGLAGRLDAAATIVCEASSFQLQDTLAFAPEVALLLNLAPDHLDRHGTFARYVRAKARAFERQLAGDLAVLPGMLLSSGGASKGTKAGRAGRGGARSSGADARRGAPEQIAALAHAGAARRVTFGTARGDDLRECDGDLRWREQPLLGVQEIALPGRHNVENAMAAAAACLARGIAPEPVCEALRTFAGVPHRLEQIASRGGVRFVNDSKATNIESTLVALRALRGEGKIHLILGGQGKGQDFTTLATDVRECCCAVYLVGEDAAAIAAALAESGVVLHTCGELEQAVASAERAAVAGDVVLLSPAAASFDQFADFEARGERFRELVCG
jgi:UDP-N-acetylmuramoylalanine--D-glutamate ligase